MAESKCCWQCPDDWEQWSQWLAAGLHARNRWRLPVLLTGILFAHGRRTVTTWLRAAGVSDDYQDYYYFLAALGCKTKSVATQLLILVLQTLPLPDRLLAVIDDTPTKRYGPHVEGADIHHNPTPGPADQKYLYGHIWVTLSLAVRHPCFGALALPLRAMLYVRQKTIAKIPKWRGWTFATKLVLAARLVEWIAPIIKKAGKTLWIVVDGGYVKAPFLKRALRAGVTVIGTAAQGRGVARSAADSLDGENDAGGAVRPSTARTRSVWPSGPPIAMVGKRPNARSMARPSPSSTRRSWRRIDRPADGFAWSLSRRITTGSLSSRPIQWPRLWRLSKPLPTARRSNKTSTM